MTLQRDVLLVPMQPTPNGALHIGHAAGTYLRADAAARALAVRGHRVAVVTGSDAFENWVLAAADAAGTTAEQVCARFHADNEWDLRMLGIRLDAWIDPRSPEHHPAYQRAHEDALCLLRATGGAVLETERVPHSARTGRPVIGTWIAGLCPQCQTPGAGSSCVACGDHFQPEELLQPTSRLDGAPLVWRPVWSWFARPRDPDAIADRLAAGARPVFAETAVRYLRRRGGRVRLSGPGTWGIRSDLSGPGAVLANGYYLYSVYCGEVYRGLSGRPGNPFTAGGASTVGIFGHDNTTPGLVAPHVLAQASDGAYAPFDRVIVHGMLTFEGQKCSTSKRHGLWLRDLFTGTSISSDELRFVLAHADLDYGPADITLQRLAETVTAYRRWAANPLPSAAAHAPSAPVPDCTTLLRLVEEQHRHLDPGRFDLSAATRILHTWMRAADRPAADWLLGLALLGEPIIPDLARHAWTQLGHTGTPTLEAAATTRSAPLATNHIPPPAPEPVTTAQLLPLAHPAPPADQASEQADPTNRAATLRYR